VRTAGGLRNTGSTGTWVGLQLPHAPIRPPWAAQGPQDTGAGNRPPNGPRGSEQGRAGRLEQAVPGVGTGRTGVVPGIAAVDRGPGTGARHGIPTPARSAVIYEKQ
jgi:hypothetical protein